ncbi:MAG: FIST N-terminal domain-containing protein [Candidatus Aenigmatarchaeota archaeon]
MSKEKILKTLEEHPAGLSISDMADESDLHRNTVSSKIKDLVEEEEVKKKKVGSAKIYYLEEYSGIHEMDSQYEGENIQVGIGVSDLSDGFKAAQSAAKQAANQAASGENPTFSLVFVSSEYNDQVEKVTKGFNKILGDDWMGCTSDSELNSILGFSRGTIEVLSLNSKYLHFSPTLIEDYRSEPKKKAKNAAEEVVDEANVERSVHATSQYMRSTKKDFSDIIKNPPYFVMTFPGGFYYDKDDKPVPGAEIEFLDGIKEVLGPHIPIIGGSASIPMENYFTQKKGPNYVFANGKYAKSGAVVAFVVSELYFSYGLEHGFEKTTDMTLITEVGRQGRVIKELDNKPALSRYSEVIDVDKEDLLDDIGKYTMQRPVSVFDTSQNIYPKVALLNPQNKEFLQGSFKYGEGQSVMISSFNAEKTVNALKKSINNAVEDRNFDPALVLFSTCGIRRILLEEDVEKAIDKVKQSYPEVPFFGFYTAGEIGGRRNQPAQYNNITATNLVISDKLQTE